MSYASSQHEVDQTKRLPAGNESFQLRILDVFDFIALNGPVSMSDVATGLRLPKSSTSRCLSKLLQQGFLTRDVDEQTYLTAPLHISKIQRAVSFAASLQDLGEALDREAKDVGFLFGLYVADTAGCFRSVAVSNGALKLSNLPEADVADLARLTCGTDPAGRLAALCNVRSHFSVSRQPVRVLWRNDETSLAKLNAVHMPLTTPDSTMAAMRLGQGKALDLMIAVESVVQVLKTADVNWLSDEEFVTYDLANQQSQLAGMAANLRGSWPRKERPAEAGRGFEHKD